MSHAAQFDVQKLFADNLVCGGSAVPASTLEGKVVAVYFSAHWCPPCRAFTPTLIAAYNAAKKEGLPFELIFVSSDEDQEGFDEYTKDMPWPSVSFDKEETRSKLGEQFGVRGIPSLQVIGKNGKLITNDGRTGISKIKEAAIKEWTSL